MARQWPKYKAAVLANARLIHFYISGAVAHIYNKVETMIFPVLISLLWVRHAVCQGSIQGPTDPSATFRCDPPPNNVPSWIASWSESMSGELGDISLPAGDMIRRMCNNPTDDEEYNCVSDGNTENDCSRTVETAFYSFTFRKRSESGEYPSCDNNIAVRLTWF